jgi:hypothetical protein
MQFRKNAALQVLHHLDLLGRDDLAVAAGDLVDLGKAAQAKKTTRNRPVSQMIKRPPRGLCTKSVVRMSEARSTSSSRQAVK